MMHFCNMSQEVKAKLLEERRSLCNTRTVDNDEWIVLYNEEGTRCFEAQKVSSPLTGRNFWRIAYGNVTLHEDCDGNPIWTLNRAALYRRVWNGPEIPYIVNTREEALEIARRIGEFVI